MILEDVVYTQSVQIFGDLHETVICGFTPLTNSSEEGRWYWYLFRPPLDNSSVEGKLVFVSYSFLSCDAILRNN